VIAHADHINSHADFKGRELPKKPKKPKKTKKKKGTNDDDNEGDNEGDNEELKRNSAEYKCVHSLSVHPLFTSMHVFTGKW